MANTPSEIPVKVRAEVEAEAPARYAVYDLSHERFVGPVTSTKPTRKEAAELVAEGHDFEVREV